MIKRYIVFFLLLHLSIGSFAQVKGEARNWLSHAYQQRYADGLAFPNIEQWQSEQKQQAFTSVAALPDSIKTNLLARADIALNYNWPSLPASLYLDYKNTGTRVNYENLCNERRKKLSQLVIGELILNNGKYIPQIVNGLWLTLEESTWVAPAHIVVQKEGADLANINVPYIDLHASRTGVIVAAIYNLLNDKFAGYSKVINRRIEDEMNRRIFNPYLKDSHYFWMGTRGNAVNNWNAFNNTNCMQAALLMLRPSDTLNRFTIKLLSSADQFVNQYPADGGCDEGPSYWDMAGGKIIRLFSLLSEASGGQLKWADKELLSEMGSYTYKMQIAGNYVVNFADAVASYSQNPQSVYTYGQLFNDEQLKGFASYLFQQRKSQLPADDVIDFIETAKVYPMLTKHIAKAPYPKVSVLPNLQVFTARSQEGSTKGLFFAAKGGHNNESHNHNDIGNFIVYADGKPLLIDAGVGTYTSKTFSKKRYEIWNVQSQWHNTPSVNGVEQQNGRAFAAKNFTYTHTSETEKLSLDLASAYPKAAEIKQWKRDFTFYPKKNMLRIVENYFLNAYEAPSVLNFLTSSIVSVTYGVVHLGETGYIIKYNPRDFEVKVEEKMMDDVRLKNVWGDRLYRVQLISKNKSLQGKYEIELLKK